MAVSGFIDAVQSTWKNIVDVYDRLAGKSDIDLTLKLGLGFGRVYFAGFNSLEIVGLKNIPRNLSSNEGIKRYYGLRPYIWLSIFNNNSQAVSVSGIGGSFIISGHYVNEQGWSGYNEPGSSVIMHFPLFLEGQREKVILMPMDWPISQLVRDRLPNMVADSIYMARYIVDGYLGSTGQFVMCTDESLYGLTLQDVLVKDIRDLVSALPSDSGNFEIVIGLANGELVSKHFRVF